MALLHRFYCYSIVFIWICLLERQQGLYENEKTEFQDFFFIFQGLNFFQILYKTTRKNALFSALNVEVEIEKGALVFFDSDSGDKNWDYFTN